MNTVLERTPFELKEIKTLQSLRSSSLPQNVKHRMSIEKPVAHVNSNSSGHFKSNLVTSMASINLKSKESSFPFALEASDQTKFQSNPFTVKTNVPLADALLKNSSETTDQLASGSILIPSVSDPMKSSPSIDFLSISPSYGPCNLSFDNQSFDETTPDEFAPINFLKGITNINYDFTFSDNSAENSISEDVGETSSNRASNFEILSNSLKLSDSMSSFNLDEFDPLRNAQNTTSSSPSIQSTQLNMNLTEAKPTTLIESEDSPNQVHLPSPLKPTATDYKGFSNSNIPSISCNTGDFSSLNYSDANEEKN